MKESIILVDVDCDKNNYAIERTTLDKFNDGSRFSERIRTCGLSSIMRVVYIICYMSLYMMCIFIKYALYIMHIIHALYCVLYFMHILLYSMHMLSDIDFIVTIV